MSTFAKATGRHIQIAFEEFDKNNPHVYALFKEQVFKAIKKKKKKLSAKMVYNVMRWNHFMETEDNTLFKDKDGNLVKFRLNDAYHSRYARKFVHEHPEHANIFNFKDLRS